MARDPEEWEDEDEEEEEEETEFDEAYGIKEQIRDICREMKKWPKVSQEYAVLSQRLQELTDSRKNVDQANNERTQQFIAERNKNVGRAQIAGSVLTPVVIEFVKGLFNQKNVNTVVEFEQNGGIANSKAMKFVK